MTCLARLGPSILENRCGTYGKAIAAIARNCSESERSDSPSTKKNRPMVTAAELDNITSDDDKKIIGNDVDEAPTNCCMSGCANCVWIQYAELLSEKLKDSDEDVQKIIMDKVQDPNMRAFLSMELRCRDLVKT